VAKSYFSHSKLRKRSFLLKILRENVKFQNPGGKVLLPPIRRGNDGIRPDCKNDNGEMTFSRHYSVFHGILNKALINEAYIVSFAEQPSFHCLDNCENKWYHLLDAQSNIQNMTFPCVKEFLFSFALFIDVV